jgi:hypothetical protein
MDFMLYHHLGMGDHIINHGLVRKLYDQKIYNHFKLIVKKHYAENVRFMYSDLKNLNIIEVYDDIEANQIFEKHEGEKLKHFVPYDNSTKFYEISSYTSLGFDVNTRYDIFKINRDYNREDYVYKKIINHKKDYIFIADDPMRGYTINTNMVKGNRDINIVRSADLLDYSMFDLLKIIENSIECHVIYSSFMMLIDCLNFSNLICHESYIQKIYPEYPNNKSLITYWKQRGVKII